MTRAMAILLPPSEGKADGGSGPPWTPGSLTLPDLDHARAQVLAALGAQAEPTMAAACRFTGVLYRELGYRSLPVAHRRRFDRTAPPPLTR